MLDLDDIADVVSSAVKSATAPLLARNAELVSANADLAKRLAALEAREMPTVEGLASLETVREMIGSAQPDLASELQPLVARMDAIVETGEERDARLAAVEQREMPSLEGYVTTEAAKSLVSDAVSAAIAEIPAPQDGKSVEPEEVQAMVDKAVAALPAPEKGEKGDKGDAAEIDMDAVREMVDELTRQAVSEQLPDAVKAIPVPEAPAPIEPDMEAIGKMIADGIAKAVSELPAPEKGADGIGLAGAMIDRDGNLVITTSDGRTHNLGLVVGKDGEAGETFTLDDFDIEQTDERTLEFKFLRGDTMHTFELEFPVPIFRGAWKEGTWRRGDMAVWGGSLWAATKDTDAKPDAPDSGWMIAARKGRDGKSVKD
ncbi:hypothetical protein [Sphingopyxis sp. NJF-3]